MKMWSNEKWARHGEQHSQWKGGRSIDGKGYVKLNINLIEPEFQCMCDSSGWVLEHRYLMAKHLQRPLTSKDIIHHIDHNSLNNEISNLELTTRGNHMRSHKSWESMRPEYVKEAA